MAKRRAKGAGRKPKFGVPRYPSGQIRHEHKETPEQEAARQEALEQRLALEAGTWRRMREAEEAGEVISIDEARSQERGSVIDNWLKISNDHRKKGKPELALVTKEQVDALKDYHELYERYTAMLVRRPRSSTDFGGAGGHDNRDPFHGEQARRDMALTSRYRDARKAILDLKDRSPMAHFAVQAIVIENREMHNLVGDLREAANALDRLRKARRAA